MSTRILRRAGLIVFFVAFVGLGSTANAGTTVADSGFRVDPNGFSFANYSDEPEYTNLNPDQVRRMFGDRVCLDREASKCVLTPSARSWMHNMNFGLKSGHCYGFSVLASLIWKQQLPRFGYPSIASFGIGPNAFDLSIEGNSPLQRAIARAVTFQTLPSVSAASIKGSPTEVLDFLIKNLGKPGAESYSLGIFQWGFQGGHEITPYAVEDMGGGVFHIRVYDNNWPGDAGRSVTVNTNSDTWSYYAATSPGHESARYVGNAKSKTLDLSPTTPGLGLQPCPFCVGRNGSKSKHNQITLSSVGNDHSRVMITDQKGRRTGFIGNRLINQIPGAKVIPRTSGGFQPSADGGIETLADSLEPTYLIPKNLRLRIRLDGRGLKHSARESLNVVGPTFDAAIEDIKMGPGRMTYATLSPKRKTLSFTGPKKGSAPRASFGAQSRTAGYRIKVSAPGAPPKSTFYFAKKPKYQLLRIAAKSKRPQRYRVVINRFTGGSPTRFARGYRIKGKQQSYLYYGTLAAPGGLARIAIGEPGKKKVRIMKVKELPKKR